MTTLIKLTTHIGDSTLWLLLAAAALAAASNAMIGTFTLLEKRGLIGDAIAHATLPGICIAFLLTEEKRISILLFGSLASGILGLLLLEYIPRHSKIKKENSVALILSIFLGIGILLLSYIQHRGNASQVGLQYILLGNITGMMKQDLCFFSLLNLILFFIILFFFKEWQMLFFDHRFAQNIGRPTQTLYILFYGLTIVSIIIGVQAVGIILMSAMLIAPPMAARFWSQELKKVIFIAVIIGIISSSFGIFISYFIPVLPSGPCIILSMNSMAFISFLIAPEWGWIAKKYRQYAYQKKVREENIIKLLYENNLFEKKNQSAYTTEKIAKELGKRSRSTEKTLLSLLRKNWVYKNNRGDWQLTEKGFQKGKSIYSLHLLWETYLKEHLGIKPDHVHDDAESIEHLITPDIEKKLRELVAIPKFRSK